MVVWRQFWGWRLDLDFFGVGAFSLWGLGPVVLSLLGFWGWGYLYKNNRINLGKKTLPQREYRES